MWLSFAIELSGGYGAEAGGRPLALSMKARMPLRGRADGALEGRVRADALAADRPLAGSIRLGRTLRYDVRFTGDDGRSWRLCAEQELSMKGRPAGFTVARGLLSGENATHPVELRFDPRGDLRRVLASLALSRREQP